MAIKPPNNLGERVDRRNQGIISGLHCEGDKGGREITENGEIDARVRYNVQQYTNAGPKSLSVLCCRLAHVVSKCSHPQPRCCYYADHTDPVSTGAM